MFLNIFYIFLLQFKDGKRVWRKSSSFISRSGSAPSGQQEQGAMTGESAVRFTKDSAPWDQMHCLISALWSQDILGALGPDICLISALCCCVADSSGLPVEVGFSIPLKVAQLWTAGGCIMDHGLMLQYFRPENTAKGINRYRSARGPKACPLNLSLQEHFEWVNLMHVFLLG
jgi:hypothetical protein